MSSTVVKKRINTRSGGGPVDYTGTVNSDGAPHGRGSYQFVEGDQKGDTYDGTWVNGKRDGFGKYTWSYGSVLSGEVKTNMLHGFGKVCCVGVFHSQCFRGPGIMVAQKRECMRKTNLMGL
jgi:hypothetical protein